MSDAAADEALRALLAARANEPIVGWKIAVNFPTFQRRLGLSGALLAPLFEARAHAPNVPVVAAETAQLHVEAEVCLTLARDIDPNAAADLRAETVARYRPCLELVDYALPRAGFAAMYEHAFFHAGVVFGEDVEAAQIASLPLHLPTLSDARGARHPRVPAAVPGGDLMQVVAHAAARIARAGTALRRGQLLLCGSYVEPLALTPGGTVQADYGFLQLGVARSS